MKFYSIFETSGKKFLRPDLKSFTQKQIRHNKNYKLLLIKRPCIINNGQATSLEKEKLFNAYILKNLYLERIKNFYNFIVRRRIPQLTKQTN